MRTIRNITMLAGACVLAALAVGAVVGAFRPSNEARELLTSRPWMAVWFALCGLLVAGFVVFGAFRRRVGIAAMHAGCVLVIGGSMWGSPAGHELQRRLGRDKAPRGHAILVSHTDATNTALYDEYLPVDVLEWIHRTKPIRPGERLPSRLDELPLDLSTFLISEGMIKPFAEVPFEVRLEGLHSEFLPQLVLNVSGASAELVGRQLEIDLHGRAPIQLPTTHVTLQVLNVTPTIYDGEGIAQPPTARLRLTRGGREETRTIRRVEGASRQELSLRPMYDSDADWIADHSPVLRLYGPGRLDTPYDFSAEVSIHKDGERVADAVLSVNNPLHYGGYHVYSWTVWPGDSRVLLMAASDSGWLAVWVGLVCVTGGAAWQFWLVPVYRAVRRRAGRRRAS